MFLNPNFDVIVIGGGPAGVAAALTCSQKGLKTCIISSIKGHSSIESVHAGIDGLLLKLGLTNCLFHAQVGCYDAIRTIKINQEMSSPLDHSNNGYHIDRKIFNDLLLLKAHQARITILKNCKVQELIFEDKFIVGVQLASGERMISKYVIDGSGFNCVGGKIMDLRKVFYSAPLVTWTGISKGSKNHTLKQQENICEFYPQKSGWTWIASLGNYTFAWTQLSKRGKQSFNAPEIFKNWHTENITAKMNTRWSIFETLAIPGIILCGDAAGNVDPSAGHGLINALYSGIKAGETAVNSIVDPENETVFLTNYDQWFRNLFLSKVDKLQNAYTHLGIEIN